ncbi:hypothetical protein QW71_36410 [Paenibacillus sp. IHB B 3415]|nr:hypothetical protein QW71_36410 [Paenibacillus sp. IHB B 3415]
MAGVKIACLAVLCMVVVVAPYAEAVTCGQVQGNLAQCLGYLRKGGAVPGPCCNGVRAMNSAAKTSADRKQTCVCLQQASKSITGINPEAAASLPGKCGVNVPYKISPSTDCSKVH